MYSATIRPVQMLELLDHPFVLKLHKTFQDDDRVYSITELAGGVDLRAVIHESASGFQPGSKSLYRATEGSTTRVYSPQTNDIYHIMVLNV